MCTLPIVKCFLIYSNDPVKFRQDLKNIALTTLGSKILTQHSDHFAELAVNAVLKLKVFLHCCCFIMWYGFEQNATFFI